MKPSRVTLVVSFVLLAAWCVLGYFFDTSAHLGWLPDWAVVISFVAPLAAIVVYTLLGVFGGGRWWVSDIGVNIVELEFALVWSNGILAWAVLLNHGLINTPGWAWAYIGGLLAASLIVTHRSYIFIRADLWARRSGGAKTRVELEAQVARLQAELDALKSPGSSSG